MTVLGVLEGLVAGVWLGGHLFTTFVVSPALKTLTVSGAERVCIRSAVGRRYGRLAGPLLLVWLVVLLLQGFGVWTFVRLALLLVLVGSVGIHGYFIGSRMQRLAEREVTEKQDFSRARTELQRFSARVTPVALVTSCLLAVFALL